MVNEKQEKIIDYYYNPNLECTCKGLFADTHKVYCKRRIRPREKFFSTKSTQEVIKWQKEK